jgi:uncharacterized protein (TIGR02300 family)
MPAKDLGTKHTCFKCGTRFYDLKKPAPICPKCGADQRESPALKAPAERKRAAPKPAPVEPAVAVPEEVEEEAEEAVDEDEEPAADDES